MFEKFSRGIRKFVSWRWKKRRDGSNFDVNTIPWDDGPEAVNKVINPYLHDPLVWPKIVESFRDHVFADQEDEGKEGSHKQMFSDQNDDAEEEHFTQRENILYGNKRFMALELGYKRFHDTVKIHFSSGQQIASTLIEESSLFTKETAKKLRAPLSKASLRYANDMIHDFDNNKLYLTDELGLYEFLSDRRLAHDIVFRIPFVERRLVGTEIMAYTLVCKGQNPHELNTDVPLNAYKQKAQKELYKKFCTNASFASYVIRNREKLGITSDILTRTIADLEFNHNDIWKKAVEPYLVKARNPFRRVVNSIFGDGLLNKLNNELINNRIEYSDFDYIAIRSDAKVHAQELKHSKEKLKSERRKSADLEEQLQPGNKNRLDSPQLRRIRSASQPPTPRPVRKSNDEKKERIDRKDFVDLPVLD